MFARALSVVVLGIVITGCAAGDDDTAATPPTTTEVVRSDTSVDATSDPVDATSDPVDATSDPVDATSDPVDATFDPVDATSDPSTDAGLLPTADAELLGYVYALMLTQITRDEAAAFLGSRIPEEEVASCMSAAGFEYIPEASPEEQVADDVRYTMSPEEYAASYGLGIAGWDLGIIPAGESDDGRLRDEPSGAQTEAYSQALGECSGALDPERKAWSDAMTVAVEQFRGVVEADERMVAGLAEWQSCLGEAGYEFETPWSMRESFFRRMNNADEDLQQIFDDEVRVAVANVSCEAAYNEVQREVISSRFAEFKAMFDAALASGASPDAQG